MNSTAKKIGSKRIGQQADFLLINNTERSILAICILIFLTSLSSIVFAEEGKSKDWLWSAGAEGYYAGTVNEVGNVFLLKCSISANGCIYQTVVNSSCEEGSQYAALINSDEGAAHVWAYCEGGNNEGYSYTLSPYDDVDILVRDGKRLAIVMPLATDNFQVSRFSLIGSTYAVEVMRALAAEAGNVDEPTTDNEDVKPAEEVL
ncbi:MAG: hypothetical protein AAF438_23400 [Pseudomonadota bacterium]